MTQKQKHTALPFVATKEGSPLLIKNMITAASGEIVAWVCCKMPKFLDSLSSLAWQKAKSKQFEIDAEFIVRACNSYYELLEAVKLGLDYVLNHDNGALHPGEREAVEANLFNAIRKATGGQNA